MKHLLLLTLALAATCSAADIRVLVWDEQQPQQKQAYGGQFLGETIAAHLKKQPGLSVSTARLDDAEQGLIDAALDGRLELMALHSAHWDKPFVRLMQERAKANALMQAHAAKRATAQWEYLNDQPIYQGVKRDAPLTPALTHEGNIWRLTLPQCVFPAYRADRAPSHVSTLTAPDTNDWLAMIRRK